jgi:hypothetical protein
MSHAERLNRKRIPFSMIIVHGKARQNGDGKRRETVTGIIFVNRLN